MINNQLAYIKNLLFQKRKLNKIRKKIYINKKTYNIKLHLNNKYNNFINVEIFNKIKNRSYLFFSWYKLLKEYTIIHQKHKYGSFNRKNLVLD